MQGKFGELFSKIDAKKFGKLFHKQNCSQGNSPTKDLYS